MESRSIEGNFITISALISACEKGHQWEIALQLLASPGHKNHGSQRYDGQGEPRSWGGQCSGKAEALIALQHRSLNMFQLYYNIYI